MCNFSTENPYRLSESNINEEPRMLKNPRSNQEENYIFGRFSSRIAQTKFSYCCRYEQFDSDGLLIRIIPYDESYQIVTIPKLCEMDYLRLYC